MAANVFHVEFGLNETALTRALESERYDLAEKLIRDTTSASYLDEGCYQRTPLYIVLCGHAETLLYSPRNFFLTKLLLERGSDVNLRIPETYPGAEFMNPGKSPLELVTDFYNELTAHEENCSLRVPWEPTRDVVIGLDKQPITTFSELLQQVLDLALIMLESGGDVNVRGVSGATLLHRTVVGSTDGRLLSLLCDGGADCNATDRSGLTPLTVACSQLGSVQGLKCDHSSCVRRHVRYLLSLNDIEVDIQDRRGRNALFYCLLWLHSQCALMLLRQSCNPCLKATVILDTGQSGSFSPLFAGLGMVSEHKRASLALLVDSGYFSRPSIVDELWETVNDVTRWRHLKIVGPQLVSDMFGFTSTTLKQLCSRVVLRRVTGCRGETTELFTHSKQRSNIDDLTSHGLTAVVKTLNLPETCMQCLETEQLAAQLRKTIRSHDWHATTPSDDLSSDSDESDTEYW